VDLRGDFADLLPGIANIRLRGSYTDYVHSELDGPALFSRYTNEVWDGRIELTHAPLFGFTGTLGVQYTDGTFTGLNVNDLHQEPGSDNSSGVFMGFLPPFEHVTENVGLYLTERRSFGPVDIELGVRKDWRSITLPTPEFHYTVAPHAKEAIEGIYERIYGPDWLELMRERRIESYHEDSPDSQHNPFSASIGATWNIANGYSAALSLARTERAPNVRELYAYGNNLATNSYEVGLAQSSRASMYFPGLRTDVMETAKTVNLTFRKAGGPLEFEVGLFHQDVSDYIFARLVETETETGVPHHYLLYTASDASFTGIDGQVSYAFSPEVHVTVFGDYVGTDLTSEEVDVDLDASDDNLPRIPPGRLGARLDLAGGPLSADIEYYHTFEQDKVALYETPTEGYGMLNATIAYRFAIEGGSELELYARGTNLTDELAFVHTSFVKNQSPLRERNVVFGLRHTF